MSCESNVTEEKSPDGLGNKNFNEPSSAQCLPGPASGLDVVTNESAEPASASDPTTVEGMGHLLKDHMPNTELPLSIRNANLAEAVRCKRCISCDRVANDAKAAQPSERFLDKSLKNAKSSRAPAGIAEPDFNTSTFQPKRIRAATSHSPLCDHSHNGRLSPNTAKGASCQKSSQGLCLVHVVFGKYRPGLVVTGSSVVCRTATVPPVVAAFSFPDKG
ncbi:hypothetical protein HPB51_020479 [Rhipicephalus microplus]|uniref:Uncharacterized protein n=1 Tax=Rhipicephalus microplus TaxID=6941 RepID=A0A9J6EIF9_RHIMP|nr:hypothetical protein HPB51_020479 [Rhipicephalus microplus]